MADKIGVGGSGESALFTPGLVNQWDFVAGDTRRWRYCLKAWLRRSSRFPAWQELKPLVPKRRWLVYFMYCPHGHIEPYHRFALERLKVSEGGLLVVCAAPSVTEIPQEVRHFADALYWKALPGYDFSAYTLALRKIASRSPHADVFVMNDSIFGPFQPIESIFSSAHWDLSGFTASAVIENHIQSYAFVLKNLTVRKMNCLLTVLFPLAAFSDFEDVVRVQETRFARVASAHMSVGANWYSCSGDVVDPTLNRPIELLNHGHPFVKRSLLGKHKGFQPEARICEALSSLGYPIYSQ
jgi:lipopolysaccharide biosynthesis protein